MPFLLNLSTILLLFIAMNTNAAVWEDRQEWSLQYEEEFSNWIQSTAVNENIFVNPGSPYYGIKADCADTAYALRAIFSYEHQLPFSITNPSGSRGKNKTINNQMNNWDQYKKSNQRLVAMINEISESVGTENLAYFDTYPTAIKNIVPGTLFMYKISARFGNFIRHAYNIKRINPVGTFEVIYSTQANKARGLPLILRKDKEFDNLPSAPWGFRKFRWPEFLDKDLSAIPAELGPSLEQYEMAKTLGKDGFFKHVKKTVANVNEPPDTQIKRLFQAICNEATARIEYVNQALQFLKSNNNRCMNSSEFDTYSTPARDQVLKEAFERFKKSFEEIIKDQQTSSVSPLMIEFFEIIFKEKINHNLDLLNACPINYRPEVKINLAQLWKRIEKGIISSHPNDSVLIRWGETTLNPTKCKRWY